MTSRQLPPLMAAERKDSVQQVASKGKTVHVKQTERGFRQSTESAMGNDILMGLIELITNSDDKYGEERGSILIHFPKPESNDGAWQVSVADKASGIPFDEVEVKLLDQGGRTSGFEHGESKRGNRGRGAKDLSTFGHVRWDIIHNGKYFWLWLDRNGEGEMSERPEPADSMRDELGIPKDGVVATISCERSRCRRPHRDRMKQRLEYAVQLRGIMSNPKRAVKLKYGDDPVTNLGYVEPHGVKKFAPVDVEIEGYPGRARIVVGEVPTPFQEDQNDPCRQGGLLIESGRAVHEATLYRFESNPYSGYFLGSVRWDHIDVLSREFDDREDENLPVDPTNNAQIIRPDRRGLNSSHPAAKAVKAAVEEVLRPHFDRKAKELGQGGKESRQTRHRLEGLARVVARFQRIKADELELELEQTTGGEVELTPEVPVLEVIPPRKLLEIGQTYTFSVRLRADAFRGEPADAQVSLSLVADPEGCVQLSEPTVSLTSDKRLEKRLTGTFTAKASTEGNGMVEVTAPGLASVLLELEIIEPEEPLPPPAPPTFEFERSSYRVPAGKRKKILLLAPTAAVERHGVNVLVESSNDHGVLIRQKEATLTPSPDGDWYQDVVEVEGRQHGATATVTAQCGEGLLRTETSISVRTDQTGPPPPEIKLAALNSFVPGTYETDEENGKVTITVNATHPAVRRYFGLHPDFPLQESIEARMMVAEVVADLTVLDLLRRHFRQQPIPVEQIYRRRFQLLNDLLPQAHVSLLSDAELSSLNGNASKALTNKA
jgi:hypothetical protein